MTALQSKRGGGGIVADVAPLSPGLLWLGLAAAGFTVAACILKQLSLRLVYCWFDQNGRRLASDYAAKAGLAFDALRSLRTDGALVRYLTTSGASAPLESASVRLTDAIRNTMPTLSRSIATNL